jgi:hypothetical protein
MANPDTSASAVANKTNFFMTIPIALFKTCPISGAPKGAVTDSSGKLTAIWGAPFVQRSKKHNHLLSF